MYLDIQQGYSVQSLSGTAVSTNAIDHSSVRNVGLGSPLAIVVQVLVGAVGGGTLTIQLQTDTTSAFGAPVVLASSPAIPAASLGIGQKVVLPVPNNQLVLRWTRLNYILATMTGITVSSWLTLASMIQNEFYVPAGITIQ